VVDILVRLPYNNRMDTNITYDIRISERQRHYLYLAIAQFCREDPGEELDEMGQDIPTVLADLLANDESLLSRTGINNFVV
jgi:hypothetical protein